VSVPGFGQEAAPACEPPGDAPLEGETRFRPKAAPRFAGGALLPGQRDASGLA
jgi:hypothetical protein